MKGLINNFTEIKKAFLLARVFLYRFMKINQSQREYYIVLGMIVSHCKEIHDILRNLSELKESIESNVNGNFIDPHYIEKIAMGREVNKKDFWEYLDELINEHLTPLPDDIAFGYDSAEDIINLFENKFLSEHNYIIDAHAEGISFKGKDEYLSDFGTRKLKHIELSFFVQEYQSFLNELRSVLDCKEDGKRLLDLI